MPPLLVAAGAGVFFVLPPAAVPHTVIRRSLFQCDADMLQTGGQLRFLLIQIADVLL